ncbi:hypothetical protein [Rhizobium leguminosarum]
MRATTLEELRLEVETAKKELFDDNLASDMRPSREEWARIQADRGKPHGGAKLPEAWLDMMSDTLEVKLAIACRRLLLAEFGLGDAVHVLPVLRPHPEIILHDLCVCFFDRLAAIDPLQWFAFELVYESSPAFLGFVDPYVSVERWLAKKVAEGNQWIPRTPEQKAERKLASQNFFRLRKLAYPTQEALNAAWHQRPLSPDEFREMLGSLELKAKGQPVGLVEKLRTMDLNNMTPIDALTTLHRLQAEARHHRSPHEIILVGD